MIDVTVFMTRINQYWDAYVASCAAGSCNQMFIDFVNIMYGFVSAICSAFGCYVQ